MTAWRRSYPTSATHQSAVLDTLLPVGDLDDAVLGVALAGPGGARVHRPAADRRLPRLARLVILTAGERG